MFVESIKTPGVAHLSYVVGSEGEACIIDPQLDIDKYLTVVEQHECRISSVIETHRNEDFISGALALKNRLGVTVYHGPNADAPIKYADTINNGDTLEIGACKLDVLTTPGHTKDSICILLTDTKTDNTPVGVFTGDTLFVNDVGRTDFYPDEMEKMAGELFDSLQKLSDLGEHVIVYPAHGAGSVCGGGMADREFTTIGIEKRSNPLFRESSRDTFIKKKVNEHHYIAPYFSKMEKANVEGSDTPLRANLCMQLSPDQIKQWLDPDSRPGTLIDIRSHAAFREKHVPGSLNLPGGLISAYGGWLLDYDVPLAFVADSAQQANEAAAQLHRMGFTTVEGYTSAIPFPASQGELEAATVGVLTADTIAERLQTPPDNWVLLDVRKQDEIESVPFPGALHIYLGHLKDKHTEMNPDIHYTCMCGSGKRATVAASYLKSNGCKNVSVFIGSLKVWQ